MLQNKFANDLVNYQLFGLRYALDQISKDYICKKCNKKHSNTKDVKNCCL